MLTASGILTIVLAAAAALGPQAALAEEIELFDGRELASIVHAEGRTPELAANLLARDLRDLTGKAAVVTTDLAACGRLCVVIAPTDSALIGAVVRDTDADLSGLAGQWERYARVAVRSSSDPSRRYLLIAGSDMRGAVWGVILQG